MTYQNCNTGEYTTTLELNPLSDTGELHVMVRDPNELIGTAEAAEILGVSKAMVTRYIKNGHLNGQIVGTSYVIRLGDVLNFERPPVGRPSKDDDESTER